MDSEKRSPVVDSQAAGSESGTPPPSEQLPPKKGFMSRVNDILGSWYYAWEIFGLVASGLAIGGIAIVVSHFDNREAPIWKTRVAYTERTFELTLNSLLSILSTFGSTCAMIPVTKCLGQLKYLWFMDKDRSMADLETFDSASRGKLGSALLAWKLRFKHLAVLGALASLLALAYGPFVQNLIEISIDYRLTSTISQLSYTLYYIGFADDTQHLERTITYTTQHALLGDKTDWMYPPNICPTGNCTWEPYYTTAACSRCSDITPMLTRTCSPESGCDVSLPNGFSLAAFNQETPRGHVMAIRPTEKPLVFDNYTNPLALVQSIIGFDKQNLPDGDPNKILTPYEITEDSVLSAHECVIVPCVQKQSFNLAKVPDPTGKAVDNKSTPFPVVVEEYLDYSAEKDTTAQINFDISFLPADQQLYYSTFSIGKWDYEAMQNFLGTILNGTVVSNQGQFSAETTALYESNKFNFTRAGEFSAMTPIFENSARGNWSSLLCDSPALAKGDVECAIKMIAAGLTSGMRSVYWENQEAKGFIPGKTFEPQNICHANWQYISAPVAVWALGVALVAGTIWKTRRAQIKTWRTSPLAMLLLTLDLRGGDHLHNWHGKADGELKHLAEDLRLRLQMGEDGPRFVRPEPATV